MGEVRRFISVSLPMPMNKLGTSSYAVLSSKFLLNLFYLRGGTSKSSNLIEIGDVEKTECELLVRGLDRAYSTVNVVERCRVN